MRKVIVFNSISLDGYFTGENGDLSWAHKNSDDPQFAKWQAGNASGNSEFVFGRITYEMMVSYWPTPEAKKQFPEVAEAMNSRSKVVFSKTLDNTDWNNTRLVKTDPVKEIRKMKEQSGPDILIFGSGTIISQLAKENLVDLYILVVVPIVLGKGRSMFDGLKKPQDMELTDTKKFNNGKMVLTYEPVEVLEPA